MTIQYRCDGPDCAVMMDEDDGRIALDIVEPSPSVTVSVNDEEVEGEYVTAVAYASFGFGSGTHHFHSPACLASWAMAKHLEDE